MRKKYQIIYADPPWQYKVWSKKEKKRSAENHLSDYENRRNYWFERMYRKYF